ncbi:hypothetical protein LY90DRAFT_678087 [Neocallimastix californiae]|uniref:G-protein coupled receptors family 1 profile domain-containing protein n=1 Tax=Neocallimastix californiae TaxID=1754190 RepID=A0A1Y1ZHJ6_9FUNG|nr:hypothetical protein LY90DRAFT_678087 [Neocallimastix californiae]|eukprot:ORY09716.1 hypothetical protein LY90DRAFT_678087 [Neocallimastix californiae]
MAEISSTTRLVLLFVQSLTAPNWLTPSVLIAMIHWLFCSLSAFFSNFIFFYEDYEERNQSKGNWLVSEVISTCFYYSAQIIGDWYPMLLLVNQDKICRYIKLTCINVNISKLMYMGLYIFTPFTTRSTITNTETSNFYEIRHYILIFISLSTILYHATIFYYIRTRFCIKYKEIMKSQNFLTKFRRISQYRIMISSGYILCSTPFIIFYIFIILFDRRKDVNSGEYIRKTFFNVPYYIIYIDQILLKNLVVVKPTSNAPPPYLNRNSASSAASDDHSNVSSNQNPPESNVRPQVTARPMLFNNWSAPQGWE